MVASKVQVDPIYDPLYKAHSSKTAKYSLITLVICSVAIWVSAMFKAFILGTVEPSETSIDSILKELSYSSRGEK